MFSAAALTSLFVNLLKKMRIMYLFNLSRPSTLLGNTCSHKTVTESHMLSHAHKQTAQTGLRQNPIQGVLFFKSKQWE